MLVFSVGEIGKKAEANIHFRLERYGENFVLLDLQGMGYLMCDSAFATIDL